MKKIFVLLALAVGVTTTSFANATTTVQNTDTHAAVAQLAANKVLKVASQEEMTALVSQLTANTNAKVVAQATDVIIIIFDDGTVIIIIIGN